MIRREYQGKPLEEHSVSTDPMNQFELWFEEAAKIIQDDPNAMILSTTGKDGRPTARTVLLKGFDGEGFVFYTNYESRKSLQIKDNEHVALTFYWPDLVRQVCIEGVAEKVPESQSDAYFRTRPAASRISAVASPQSREIDSRARLEKSFRKVQNEYGHYDEIERPSFWGGFLVRPYRIEFWQGRINRLHDRICYLKEEGRSNWKRVRLAP